MRSLVPFRQFESMRNFPLEGDWMDRMLDRVMPALFAERGGIFPEFDIVETGEHIVVKADLPGIDVNDLDINVVDNVLTVRGERKEEYEESKEQYHRIERRCGSFRRSFALPAEVDTEGIEAHYHDGVLTLKIPKSEAAKHKRIEVKVH
jgi:HSP20 family protein